MAEHSRIPVVKHYEGICHVYLDEIDNLPSAVDIVLDSKCLMPEVCNAAETLLVSRAAAAHLGMIVSALSDRGVSLRGCNKARQIEGRLQPATEADWRTEYLDMVLSIRIVDGVEQAIKHINTYGSHHTDTIVSSNAANARRFVDGVDSAVVLVNASTMFCDGQSLGMGAEIGISTDKVHARGPMGLEELTTYKFVIHGTGHIMGTWTPQQETSTSTPQQHGS